MQYSIDAIQEPVLLMQSNPRQVVTANQKACELFGKDLNQIQGFRGGQVFDCIHSFTEAGCGLDENCENCKIKNAVVETFESGIPKSAETTLTVKKDKNQIPFLVKVATEKKEDFALLYIHKYEQELHIYIADYIA